MTVIRVTHKNCHQVALQHEYEAAEIVGTYGATVQRLLRERGSLLLLEHDVDPAPEQVAEVLAWAEHSDSFVLAARYWIYPVTTGLANRVCAHRPRMGSWLDEEGLRRIEYFGLGCTFLPESIADLIDPSWDYPALDYLISQAWLDAGRKAYALPIWVEHHHKD